MGYPFRFGLITARLDNDYPDEADKMVYTNELTDLAVFGPER
jgi:hypothetical protein